MTITGQNDDFRRVEAKRATALTEVRAVLVPLAEATSVFGDLPIIAWQPPTGQRSRRWRKVEVRLTALMEAILTFVTILRQPSQ